MAKPGHSSFRRILLSRLLLLSIPVVMTGEIVAYQKAHSGLLETAQFNLAESAVQKSTAFRDRVAALRSHLSTATLTTAMQSGAPGQIQSFLDQWVASSDTRLECAQVTDLQTQKLIATTCGSQRLGQLADNPWTNPLDRSTDGDTVQVSVVGPTQSGVINAANSQLQLVLRAPVYVALAGVSGRIEKPKLPRYALTVQTALQQLEVNPGITGYTLVIDQEGTVLAHPDRDSIGENIQHKPDSQRFQAIVTATIAGQADRDKRFTFTETGTEWIAGSSLLTFSSYGQSPLAWVVLAAVPVETALTGLNGMTQVLFILTIGLFAAILLATLYLAKDLAFPIEQLSDYALQIHQRYATDRIPKNFKVKELNYLAEALDSMVKRLEDRAEELETAWQEAQVANQLKSEFLATTSHELRTPLNAIVGCVRLVRDGCCDDRQEELEFLQQADDAALHLLKIINDLLDIAKIEAGKVELNLQPIGIQELCRQCLKMVQPGAQMKRITLSLQLDDLIDRVPLDERRVRQMVINLLSNAVKFTPEAGQVTLTASLGYGYQLEQDTRPDLSPVNPHTTYLCLEVKDSGIGIPQDRWHLLFRPFQQIDSSLTRKHEGTGLGLALTKRLAELHGGTLSFRSTPSQGSTFRIWLPALEAKPSDPTASIGLPEISSHSSDVANALPPSEGQATEERKKLNVNP